MKDMLNRHLSEQTKDKFVIEMNMPTYYPPIEAAKTEEGGVRERFFKSLAELPDEVTVVHPFNVDAFSEPLTIYVAENGDDAHEGTKENPIATLHEAARRAEGKGGAKIILRGGSYTLTEPVVLTEAHSGTEESPLIFTAEKGEAPMISAGMKIPASAFVKLTDEKMLSRLKPEVRDNVLVADITAAGITEFGTVAGSNLFLNSAPLTLARYPNDGEPLIPVGERIIHTGYEDRKPSGDWEIGIEDEKCLEWEWNDEIHIHGALCYEWNRYTTKIQAFDRENKTMRGFGAFENAPVMKGERNNYYFRNVFEELDLPGEWYLDRNDGKLYLWPPKALEDSDDLQFVAVPCDLFNCEGVSNVIFDRLDLGRCAGAVVSIAGGRQVLVQRCRVAGTCPGKGEKSAISVNGEYRCGVTDTYFEHFSNKAVDIGGGDRMTFTPANNFLQNSVLENPHHRFAICTSGCGNIISHNYVHNTTLVDNGNNEEIVEYNVFKGGDTETHDSGTIYVGGGGGSVCGNHYRYNYLYDFQENDYGIYFDDLTRGMYAYGNVVVGNGNTEGEAWYSGGRSYNHHNGGEHCFWNNVSIDAGYFAFGGDISYWLLDSFWDGLFPGIYNTSLGKRTERYLGRNPTYRDYCAALDQYVEDKKDPNYVVKSGWAERRLRTPWCNHYENNVIVRASRPYKLDNGEETATGLDTNYITNDDPGFVDFEGKDYNIRPDAPLYEKIPDFKPIPFSRMGTLEE
ncbi:MAG: right-handed parallel beta-helix repeat-containing protein [Clostridia bacterium]|nr:right-handed parallel beta-helix repeat-containing protein [Clostridia bacterium]